MFKKAEVTSFDKILLKISGMRGSVEYEILCRKSETEISLYQFYYRQNGEERELCKQGFCDTNEFIAFLNDCGIMRWDGFEGKHPRGVLDGRMFRFYAEVNGGTTIRANGSENFPRHFRDFEDKICSLIHDVTQDS